MLGALESMSDTLERWAESRLRVDGSPLPGHSLAMDLEVAPALNVRVERHRSTLRVVARSVQSQPQVCIEATFSGGPDGSLSARGAHGR